ncbi:hypothetical protein [Noviherbaspirillum sp.]|uniref:hypothetical protein n=1 Tax=Noviherbaspirillum sp. TaxID=1926288 RepID=UPI002B459A9E|nr:hypothetical protein [Noviherbaspirillum sp.]HJV80996.1 hypothetical protein [Noviherbaspirillum sp.]
MSDTFDAQALSLLPSEQRALLKEWLKSSAPTRRWDALLKQAGTQRIETAEMLADALAACGAAILEEHFERAVWRTKTLIWRDYESLCAAMGMTTRAARRIAFSSAWDATQNTVWRHAALSDAYLALRDASSERSESRLALLTKLNQWLATGQSGTRREFALFARGQTKQISHAEWAWLSEYVDLADCGIERHTPAFWISGAVELDLGGRCLNIDAAGDFIALTPDTIRRITGASTHARHYRLIENRTSFENVVRQARSSSAEIVIWLPGYAPSWWRSAMEKLLEVLPRPARISCDADPDGVQIAMNAGALWSARGLCWEPFAMSATDASDSPSKLPLAAHDIRLAQALLMNPALPTELAGLLRWCLDNDSKVEQENWL